jgi:hypothetical protein
MEFRNQYKKRGVIEKPKSRKIINFLNMKMIKILSTVMFSVVLFSCGGKSTNKKDGVENETEKKEVVTDCNISELINLENLKDVTKKDSKELFTGIAIEKDQNDSIIKEIHVKNGWVLNQRKREKLQNEYITLSDYEYENGKALNGWEIEIEKDKSPDYYYVSKFNEVKSGNPEFNSWRIKCFSGENSSIYVSILKKDGINVMMDMPEKKLKYFKDAKYSPYAQPEDMDMGIDIKSPKEYIDVLNSLKNELHHFNYWKK